MMGLPPPRCDVGPFPSSRGPPFFDQPPRAGWPRPPPTGRPRLPRSRSRSRSRSPADRRRPFESQYTRRRLSRATGDSRRPPRSDITALERSEGLPPTLPQATSTSTAAVASAAGLADSFMTSSSGAPPSGGLQDTMSKEKLWATLAAQLQEKGLCPKPRSVDPSSGAPPQPARFGTGEDDGFGLL